MEVREGALTCTESGSPLSVRATADLEAIVAGTAEPAEPRPEHALRWGVNWFCPADAEPLREVEGTLKCDSCGRVVPGKLVYQLVEFNPH